MNSNRTELRDILHHIRQGLSGKDIADRYGLSEEQFRVALEALCASGELDRDEIARLSDSFAEVSLTVPNSMDSNSVPVIRRSPPQVSQPTVRYRLESLAPGFPENIWKLSSYKNPFRIVALIIVMLNAFNLTCAYYSVDRPAMTRAVAEEISRQGYIKKFATWLYETLWQGESPPRKVDRKVNEEVESNRLWAWLWLLGSLGLLWIVFDWERAMAYVSSGVLFCLTMIYIVSPIDVVPDFTPFAGQVDDVGVGVGGFGLAFLIFKRYHEKRAAMEFLKAQRVEKPEILMQKLVTEQGYRITRVDEQDDAKSETARTINFERTS